MNLVTLVNTLTDAGFNVFKGSADDGTPCPYVVIENVTHPNFGADNRVYAKSTRLRLRLVESEVHDWELVEKLENALDELGLFYSSDDVTDESEHVCEMHYLISFFGGNTNA